jgi:exopolysaccharide biosynthesis predicted pyruvyltransferase EpsI
MTTNQSGSVLSIRRFLEEYRGAAIFHPPLVDDKGVIVGNNGDRLMVMGTDLMYRDLGIRRIDDPKQADLLVLGASGGMLDKFTHIPRMFSELSQSYPDKPMCVLPSTFYYPTRPLADDIGARTAPLSIFCRERYSYRHLTEDHRLPDACRVYLDQDMAFELESGEYVARVRTMDPRHILIVERVDVEHVSVALGAESMSMTARKMAGRILPPGVKQALYPLVKFMRSKRHTPFRECCERLLSAKYPELNGLPRMVADVSNVNTCSFEEFTEAVGHAAAVFTTRLHVAILGAMAGKPTFVFEGPYHKIRGIYEHSLASRPGITFVPLSEQGLS